MVRGAFFKRIEEEGLGGWAPAPRRCIRTVGITDSAIMFEEDVVRHYQEFLERRRAMRPELDSVGNLGIWLTAVTRGASLAGICEPCEILRSA